MQWDPKNRQDRELAARLASASQAHEEREDMTRAHAAELRAMVLQWQADQARLGRYDSVQLPLAAERVQAALAAYRAAPARWAPCWRPAAPSWSWRWSGCACRPTTPACGRS